MTSETTLSSRFTIVSKIFVTLWVLAFGLITANVWMSAGVQAGVKWLLLTVWIVSSIFVLSGYVRLKRVCVVGDNLYVSNYLKEIVVPLTSIEGVTELRWTKLHPVTIHFRDDTAFGRKITFMPKSYIGMFWSSHPVVGQIKQMVEAAKVKTGI